MKTSFWYILAVPLTIGLAVGLWYIVEDKEEIRASVSVAEAMNSGGMEGYKRVTGPREFIFPDDHGAHPGYKTEWWYYTGNVFTESGRQFGYQFTIFRNQLTPPTDVANRSKAPSNWNTNQLYLGHLAISDVENEDHIFEERYSRGAVGLAGAEADPYRIWIENWEIKRMDSTNSGDQNFAVHIKAKMQSGAAIDLNITPAKPLVLQGDKGYDRKGTDAGNASYYFSFTRMKTEGMITKNEKQFRVSGTSWMDHEWSTSALGNRQEGWDWFSIQLSNGYDLMYYQLRNKDGSISKFTTGSLIGPDGQKTTIGPDDVNIEVLDKWKSPHSKSVYPAKWTMNIPKANLFLDLQTSFPDQVMDVSVRYYEGTISISGTMNEKDIGGTGFIEMTGYEEK
ncbi:putative secreted hydrolase [Fodinibius salinus]|uniref:Putative secreted hydrolase n=1 Tax=Fodinibius salinus TaxID=860790 RepID=A0A5D3YK58_9BACT|nr:lipocalin-like domain-containing protein [Fodinibius salinus]TYP93888.1 putative secreted hydrolase [Fodinibius salinus]